MSSLIKVTTSPLRWRCRFAYVAAIGVVALLLTSSRSALAEEPTQAQRTAAPPAPDSPTQDAAVVVPKPSVLAVRYHQSGNWLWGIDQAWDLLVPAVWLFSGASARLRTLAKRLGRVWFGTIAIYAVAFIALSSVINLPLEYYQGFVRPHAYGLSNQSFAKWLHDAAIRALVSMSLGAMLLWILYLLIDRSPKHWWLYAWVVAVPLHFLTMLVVPVWYAPLFNRFGPMHDQRLERKILALARRSGIEGSRVFEVAKSEDTKTVNAYVTGFWGTKRIVLWDTLLAGHTDNEVLAVMGHEIGHYVLGHVVRSLALLSGLSLLGFGFIHVSAQFLLRRRSRRFGFDSLADVASLPLLLFLLHAFSLAAQPMIMAVSRAQEHEADRFSLEITRLNHDGALGFAKRMEENLGIPRPGWFYTVFRATHPSAGDRIEFCNAYQPWLTGGALRYGAMFERDHQPEPTGPVLAAPSSRATGSSPIRDHAQ
jgi:STE24 endopeptidase